MIRKKFIKCILIIITISISALLFKVYITNKATAQQKNKTIEAENKSLRFSLKLQNKKYYYKDLDVSSNTSHFIIGNGQNIKYSSYSVGANPNYVTTIINKHRALLYCNIYISKANKDYIEKVTRSNDIDVTPFNNNDFVCVNYSVNNNAFTYILNLKTKSIVWTKGTTFESAGYDTATDTVICTHNILPTDDIWGKMKYENYQVNMYGETHQISTTS